MTKGQKPKPLELKILHGVHKKNPQRINQHEPASPPGIPDCPSHLTQYAREEWDRIVPLMTQMGVIAKYLGTALEIYCTAYGKWRLAVEDVEQFGLSIDTEHGPKRNPNAIAMENLGAQLHRWLAEFGFTPSSKTRVQVENKQPQRVAARQR